MKVGVYSIWAYNDTPTLETDLEIVQRHLDKGDTVEIIGCRGALKCCSLNPRRKKGICILCRSRFNNGLSKLEKTDKLSITYIDYKKPERDFLQSIKNIQNIDELKVWTWDGCDLGSAVLSSMISELRDHRFVFEKYRSLMLAKLKMSWLVYEYTKNMVEKFSVFYLENGRYAESRPFLRRFENDENCTVYTIERAGIVGKYALFENHLPHNYIEEGKLGIARWNNAGSDREELGSQYFEERVEGKVLYLFSSFDPEKVILPDNYSPEKRNIAVFASTMDEYEAIPGWENPLYYDEIEALEDIVAHFVEDNEIHFYLRLHPQLKGCNNEQLRKTRRLEDKRYPNLTILWPESSISSYNLLFNCEKVLSFGSTLGLEACYWEIPSIMVGHAYWEKHNCCYIPENREEIYKFLENKELAKLPKLNSLIWGYREKTNGIDYVYFQNDRNPGKWKVNRRFSFLLYRLNYEGKFNGYYLEPDIGFLGKVFLIIEMIFDVITYKKIIRKMKKVVGLANKKNS